MGVDVTSVADVAASVQRFGHRYLDRIYTAHELDSCQGAPDVVAAGLAARFAAKEATMKALRIGADAPPWRSIEVRRDPSGACDLVLSDDAARMADEAGIQGLSLTMSHEGPIAVAVVAAWNQGDR